MDILNFSFLNCLCLCWLKAAPRKVSQSKRDLERFLKIKITLNSGNVDDVHMRSNMNYENFSIVNHSVSVVIPVRHINHT